jgi:hypothetical protein
MMATDPRRLLCVLGVSLFLASSAMADPEPSAALYDALVTKAESGDTAIDYAALRLSYTQTDHYEPYPAGAVDLMLKAFKAMNDKNCPAAVESARAAVKLNYVEFRAHAILADCYEQAGDAAGHDRELAISGGIVKALLASGDGKSPETAYRVVTISEEYFILEAYYKAQRQEQSLINNAGHMYDSLTGKLANGESVTLFFNIDPIFAAEGKLLGLKQ